MTPGEERPISSWVHDHLSADLPEVAADLVDNRPAAVHCVRPEVTLLEKIEAMGRKFRRTPYEPAAFVRHYEDSAHILRSDVMAKLPEARMLLDDMRNEGYIRDWPSPLDRAFAPAAEPDKWAQLETAWRALGPLYWGPRITLSDAAREIQAFLALLSAA